MDAKLEEKAKRHFQEIVKKEKECLISYDGIKKILPHKEPAIMVSRVMKLEDSYVEAEADILFGNYYLNGHFPGNPVIMGMLLGEICNQAAAIMLIRKYQKLHPDLDSNKIIYPMLIGGDNLRIFHPVKPPRTVSIYAKIDEEYIAPEEEMYKGNTRICLGKHKICTWDPICKIIIKEKIG